jgi:hypothetical protein
VSVRLFRFFFAGMLAALVPIPAALGLILPRAQFKGQHLEQSIPISGVP